MFHVKQVRALFINPFIYDFAAYNFWSKPLGLLYIASILRKNGFEISFIDCMEMDEKRKKDDGRGHYIKEKVEKPKALMNIEKPLRRYGISPSKLSQRLHQIKKPEIVLITSLMTYWYPGTAEVVNLVREVFLDSKIIVGGIYPSLCEDHAKKTLKKADLILKNHELGLLYKYLEEKLSVKLSFKPGLEDFDIWPYPAFDLYEKIDFVPILTSYGCVFNCAYCATNYLYPKIRKRDPKNVIDEISYWILKGVRRFVLYDDCFLHDAENHAIPILCQLIRLSEKIEIFNPNALNAAFIDNRIAELLFLAGFKEVRIGLESISKESQRITKGKINLEIFERAISALMDVGFEGSQIHVYLLAGLPFQRWEEVKEGIDYVLSKGLRVHIAEYAPCPHTEIFEKYKTSARFPIEKEPLFQNNSLFPFSWSGFNEGNLQFLKSYLREKSQYAGSFATQRVPQNGLYTQKGQEA